MAKQPLTIDPLKLEILRNPDDYIFWHVKNMWEQNLRVDQKIMATILFVAGFITNTETLPKNSKRISTFIVEHIDLLDDECEKLVDKTYPKK